MPLHPATDEWAQRAYEQATRSRVIKGISRYCAAHALTLVFLRHDSVQEDDRVRGEVVFTDAGESAIDPRLVPACHGVVGDCHAHARQLCQKPIRVLIGRTLIAFVASTFRPWGLAALSKSRAATSPASSVTVVMVVAVMTHLASVAKITEKWPRESVSYLFLFSLFSSVGDYVRIRLTDRGYAADESWHLVPAVGEM
jgi:hypothetical protein